ncbi:DNA/RNA helicase domain-containing protein [Nocardia sp. NPDC006044]|uniref:DNA/RNA helicase domain-containing protein n=1 Tax=Nocardia sp. NPDC006044 TaxID=3364306 RepID=UPI0036850ABD
MLIFDKMSYGSAMAKQVAALGPAGIRVGQRVRDLRRHQGLTLHALASKLADLGRPIDISALAKVEKGQRRIDVDDLMALAVALDASPNWILLPDRVSDDSPIELTPSHQQGGLEVWQWAVRDHPDELDPPSPDSHVPVDQLDQSLDLGVTQSVWSGAHSHVPYESVLSQVKHAFEADNKRVIIVMGGPGSGKSMIAMSLLSALRHDHRRVVYASGSSARIEYMRKSVGKGRPDMRQLFTYYSNLATAAPNGVDVLICDDAHRIQRTSSNRFAPRGLKTDRPQVDELISAARVPVFFLDENQIVRPDEVGTVDLITDHAARLGLPVIRISLDGRFRYGGSAAYEEWMLNLLGLRALGPTKWKGDKNFDVRVAASPQEMEDFLRTKINGGETARIAAGYCWPWNKQLRTDGSLVNDVTIGNWSKPWAKFDRKLTDAAPPAEFWATDPRGFDQIGSVYTAQGFEYDWAGVILGQDIVVDGQNLTIRRDANMDRALKGTKGKPVYDQQFDNLVRNSYKVLLTRGMRGVVIYAVDPATQEFLASLVD